MNRKKWLFLELLIYVVVAILLLALFMNILGGDRRENDDVRWWSWANWHIGEWTIGAVKGHGDPVVKQTLSADKDEIRKILVRLGSDDVTVETTTDDQITVEIWANAETNIPVAQIVGNTLEIKNRKKTIGINLVRSYVTIKVPEDMDYEYDMGVISGDIDVRANGEMELVNVSGEIIVSGRLSGVQAKTVSGDIEIESLTMPRDGIDADTVSGEIYMIIPENDGFTLEYGTVSGKVKNAFTEADLYKSGKDRYLDGRIEFDVETISGNVKIEKYKE